MEDKNFLQSTNNDDEIFVKQKDGSFKLVKISELNNLKLTSVVSSPVKKIVSASATQVINSIPAPKQTLVSQPRQSLTPAPTPVRPLSPPLSPVPVAPPKQFVPVSARQSPAQVKPAPQQIFIPTIEHYDTAVEKLTKESGLNVALELQQRFKMIVVSRLKEVRKWVETRQKLMSPLESGGMGFAYEQAEKFLKLVDEKKEELLKNAPVAALVVSASVRDSSASPQNDKKKVVTTPPPLPPVPPPSPVLPTPASVTPPVPKRVLPPKDNFSKDSSLRQLAEARNDKNEIASALPRNDIKKTSSDIVKATPQPLKIVQQEKVAPKVELAPLLPAQIKPAQKIAIPQTPAGRSKMEDVAYKPRLVGPVEELREMTLVDFRRLSPQAKVTADKIYAKIELLAEESYEKKILGIKAWQESEVNKMYLGLLNESVDRAMPVQKMIEERQGANRPSLTYEEFKTVMELNRRLRN